MAYPMMHQESEWRIRILRSGSLDDKLDYWEISLILIITKLLIIQIRCNLIITTCVIIQKSDLLIITSCSVIIVSED